MWNYYFLAICFFLVIVSACIIESRVRPFISASVSYTPLVNVKVGGNDLHFSKKTSLGFIVHTIAKVIFFSSCDMLKLQAS